MKVLIIEDNQDIAASICEYLESLDYAVDIARDGMTGLNLAITKDYSVIVLDLGLPDIDGVDLCHRLRQDDQGKSDGELPQNLRTERHLTEPN